MIMNSETKTYDLARMLRAGEVNEMTWSNDELGQLLQEALDEPIPSNWSMPSVSKYADSLDVIDDDNIPSEMETASTIIKPSKRDLILERRFSFGIVEQLKAEAKALRTEESSGVPKEVATVVYFCAIAAALVHYNKRITSLRDAKIVDAFDWCLKRSWMSPDLQSLLEQAKAKL